VVLIWTSAVQRAVDDASCPYANWVLGFIEIDIASRLLLHQESERLYTSADERYPHTFFFIPSSSLLHRLT
jgi:hypothetical protein